MFTKEECIQNILSLQETNPDRIISRDFFRNSGEIPEKDWVSIFGDFNEFKRQAGLQYTRSERKFLTAKSKHSSVDNLRDFNREKYGWSDLYPKSFNYRFQTFLVGSDFHDIQCDPFYRRMFIEAAKKAKPTKIIFNGDLFDLPEFSSYSKRPQDFIGDEKRQWVWDFMEELRNVAPDAEFIVIEGNHEYRLVKYLIEKAPVVMDMLHTNGWGVKEFLGLDQFEVNYYSRADFGTFTETDIKNEIKRNYYNFRNTVLFHHFPEGKEFGIPGCSGHHHKYKVWDCFNKTFGSYNWYQTGGGSRKHVEYMNTMGEKWQNGFVLVTVDLNHTKNTIFDYIDCTNELCKINGEFHMRTDKELQFLT